MPTLHEVQRAMLRSIIDRADEGIAGVVIGDGIAPAARLGVYRNNSASALIEATRLSYPAVERLVGAEFFDGCAHQFVRDMPPRTAWLYEYGGAFGDFLAKFPPAAQLPYLPDVARLEWAINDALHAVDCPGLDPAGLAALAEADPGAVRFTPHPAVRLLRVDYPVDVIWRAVIEEDDAALGKVDLSEGPCFLLVERGGEGVQVVRLGEGEWRFTAALFAGDTLEAALENAGDIDVPTLLATHFTRRRIAAFGIDGSHMQTTGLEATS